MGSKMREVGAFALWILIALAFMFSYLTFITKILGIRLGMEGGAFLHDHLSQVHLQLDEAT